VQTFDFHSPLSYNGGSISTSATLPLQAKNNLISDQVGSCASNLCGFLLNNVAIAVCRVKGRLNAEIARQEGPAATHQG
jgi:hypothetical protein